jgi:hypothetical protein
MTGMKLAALPIEYLIVISNPSTIIKLKSGYSREYEKICHSADLENKIKELEKKYQREMISPKEWKKLHRLLLMKHSPHNTDLLQAYSIPREDLLTGVLCPTSLIFLLSDKKAIGCAQYTTLSPRTTTFKHLWIISICLALLLQTWNLGTFSIFLPGILRKESCILWICL